MKTKIDIRDYQFYFQLNENCKTPEKAKEAIDNLNEAEPDLKHIAVMTLNGTYGVFTRKKKPQIYNNVIQEPESEYKAKPIDNWKKIAYLNRIMLDLERIKVAHQKLNDHWTQDSDYDLDLNQYLADMYPFTKSLDELQIDVNVWVEHGVKLLFRTRKALEPNLADRNIVKEDPEEYATEQRMKEIRRLRSVIRAMEEEAKPKYYVISVWCDVEPSLSRPFDTPEERDIEAKRIRKEDDEMEDSGIYPLDVINGKPKIDSYSGMFFDEHDEINEEQGKYSPVTPQFGRPFTIRHCVNCGQRLMVDPLDFLLNLDKDVICDACKHPKKYEKKEEKTIRL